MKRLLLLLIPALLSASPALAYDFQVGKLYYNRTSDTTVQVTYQTSGSQNYEELSGPLSIPKTVKKNGITYTVTAIGSNAF